MVIHLIVALMLALGIGSGLNVPEFSPALVLAETSTALPSWTHADASPT